LLQDDRQDWSWTWHVRTTALIFGGLGGLFLAARLLLGMAG
jgi:hypothetical protein